MDKQFFKFPSTSHNQAPILMLSIHLFEYRMLTIIIAQIGYGSNKKTRFLMPSGHKAFLVHNSRDVDLLLMHNKTFAAEYVVL